FGLNAMADQFQGLIAKLEERIKARTRDLETVAEVNAQISTILDSTWLLQHVVDLTKERFNPYHSQIYLLDESGEKLELMAGAGVLGIQMMADRDTIDVSDPRSVIASAVRSRKAVHVNDVSQTENFLPHPQLKDTRSE